MLSSMGPTHANVPREARRALHVDYGSRSERGTEGPALFYSLIESARLAGVEPDSYLRSAARAAIRGRAVSLPHQLVNPPEVSAPDVR